VSGEVKLPWPRSSLIGRFDRFDWDTDGGKSPLSRVIAGHAFHFLPPNDLLSTMEQVNYPDPGIPTDRILRATPKVEYPQRLRADRALGAECHLSKRLAAPSVPDCAAPPFAIC
jgi:hypothetical protein